MAQPGFIHIADLHKQYLSGQGQVLHILRGLDLDIAQADTVSIMGASGVGKSTLLHLIGGLDTPDQGRILIDGRPLEELSEDERAHFRNETVGFVFQFHHLLMDFTALENVMMPMWIKAGRTRDVRAQGLGLLEEVGLGHRAQHRPANLSGGEQQRLAIARAIANQPAILLADEPTGNLDEDTGAHVTELLLRLNGERRMTMVLVTHNPHIAARMRHQYVLEHGRLHAASRAQRDA
ncbi:MAG: ABC transporter ATP-binding protein [Candidatus Lambdaproteobacteria bacterium]|nr:ABC transporter ATP-binding protein [Candidatus Lambdaproteobacteria bacterium]